MQRHPPARCGATRLLWHHPEGSVRVKVHWVETLAATLAPKSFSICRSSTQWLNCFGFHTRSP